MSLIPSTTYFPCPGALIPRSTIIEWRWYKNDIIYSVVAHIYCSAQPSVSSHIYSMLTSVVFVFDNSIKQLLCAVVVVASCFLSSYKKEWNNACCIHSLWMSLFLSVVMHWNVPIWYPQWTHIYFHHNIMIVFGWQK